VSEAQIIETCRSLVSQVLNRPIDDIAIDQSFVRLGLDSANFVSVLIGLEELLDLELEADLMAEHPTIALLAVHLATRARG